MIKVPSKFLELRNLGQTVKLFCLYILIFFFSDHEICHSDIRLWGTICRTVIHHLRNNYLEYKNLYANYPAFNKGSKCELRNVRLPQMPEPVRQNSLPCFARSWMIPIGIPNQFLQYHNEIIIFPYTKSIIMIFSRIPNTDEYIILKFYSGFKWPNALISRSLFTTPIPYAHEITEELYSDLRANCSEFYFQRYVFR